MPPSMLLTLNVRDFVIVDALELEFGPGFTVLTGETGAGKSILIDALELALGERADAGVVREGALRAEVIAEFRLDAAAADWLAQRELAGDGDTALLRRTVDAAGRSRAFVNDTPVSLAQLRELGEQLVDIHGQHAHQSLLRPAAQLLLLDQHGQLGEAARGVGAAYARLRAACHARLEAESVSALAVAEKERLQWIVEELDLLAPEPGEWERISGEHKRLAHAASLMQGARAAIESLAEQDAAALTLVDAAAGRLAQLSGFDARLAPVVALLESARNEIDEAARELNHYLGHADLDEARLARVEARLSMLHAAARKLKCAPEALAQLQADSSARMQALSAASDLDALRRAESEAQQAYDAQAQQLSARRAAAAEQMGREVTRAMQDLSMAGGRFSVELQAGAAGATGLERAEFLVAGHAGATPRPLAKVASGGELSRISLAISVIAASATRVGTLIFDEVDAGIGGAVAETVGRLLKQLGTLRQVLCVTHLPQVAAQADRHLLVNKRTRDDAAPVSDIAELNRSGRVEELARMLGGQQITDTTRKHAREMLAR
jgi:DNA repair protein RecN (Recombination protein N)